MECCIRLFIEQHYIRIRGWSSFALFAFNTHSILVEIKSHNAWTIINGITNINEIRFLNIQQIKEQIYV